MSGDPKDGASLAHIRDQMEKLNKRLQTLERVVGSQENPDYRKAFGDAAHAARTHLVEVQATVRNIEKEGRL